MMSGTEQFDPKSYIEGVEEAYSAFISCGVPYELVEKAMEYMGMSPSGRQRIEKIWYRTIRVNEPQP